ncbi:MAG: hypothetical protein HZA36_00130 [Parcubacteria group bacterium]|nr:hypothetical protein [Parcubacteria group bacterium]
MPKLSDKKADDRKEIKALLISILIYIIVNALISILLWRTGESMPSYIQALFSIIPALYFYNTGMANGETKIKRKFNWIAFVLSVVFYYIVQIWLSTFLFLFTEFSYRTYSALISFITAFYFYQFKKEQSTLKKDMLWIGVIGVLTFWLLLK